MSIDFNEKICLGGSEEFNHSAFKFFNKRIVLNGAAITWQDIVLSGNGSLSLTNAKADGLNYLKLFGGTEQRNLPKGYTQYEYLRSSGTQYIDLGYKGNGNTKVKIKFRYHTATSATGSGRVFGSRNTSQIDAFAIGSASGIVSAEGTNKVFWCYDGQPYYVDDTTFGLDVWKTVVFSATEHTIDGVTVGDDYTVTEFETPYNLKLFGFDNNGTIGVGYVDIAYCQLWDNGVLVRDLVPASYGTTNSMYDRVSGAMLPNAGTGNFVAGSAAVPTPDEPLQIVSNNGVIKYSLNMANVNEQTALIGYYISSSGVVTVDGNNWIYQNYIPVKPNTTYTLTMSTSVYYVTISEYSTADDSGFIIRKAGSSGDNTSLTITTESTTNYVRFGTNLDRSAVTLDRVLAINWMLNQGSSIPYAPYSPNSIYTDGTVETVEVDTTGDTATAEMLLSVGDIKDVQSVLDGVITKNVGILILDGTESWQVATGTGYKQFYSTGTQGVIANSVSLMSTIAPYGCTASTRANYDFGCYSGGNGNLCFQMIGSSTINTTTDWTNYLSEQYQNNTPVIVIYPKLTATTESVTGQTLTTQSGSNTITITQASINNLPLEVSYKGTN